jgi:FAD/FMN-containing dehydrogenase
MTIGAALTQLRATLGPEWIFEGSSERALAGQDVFTTGRPVAAVARPTSVADVQQLVAVAREHSLVLAPRGGGMSYTRGYLTDDPARTIVVDMQSMAAIREINPRDMYAIVEPGCTWQALDEALAGHDLEVPYRGPVSGRLATIGGGISQNAVFYGSGLFGTAADNVLGVEVVAGTGDIIRTGSLAISGGSPFLRHFGPDLTGLFTADCGAMGLKTAIVLKLRRRPALRDAVSFSTPALSTVLEFIERLGIEGIASQITAMDVRLQHERIAQAGWGDKLRHAGKLLTGSGSAIRKVGEASALARAGMASSPGRGFAIHVFLEGLNAADCARQAERVAAIAGELGLPSSNPAVALAMVRTPFGPVTGLGGAPGERWVPVHFILPHSRAAQGMALIQAVLDENAAEMAAAGIKVRHLLANLGAGAVTLEPMFLWRDRLTDLAYATIAEQGGKADTTTTANPVAEALVSTLRRTMVARVDAIGAVHTQLGRQYPYLPRLAPETAALFSALHRTLDPDGVMNPGALGTPALPPAKGDAP